MSANSMSIEDELVYAKDLIQNLKDENEYYRDRIKELEYNASLAQAKLTLAIRALQSYGGKEDWQLENGRLARTTVERISHMSCFTYDIPWIKVDHSKMWTVVDTTTKENNGNLTSTSNQD